MLHRGFHRREWILHSLAATGWFATVGDAELLAATLDANSLIDENTPDENSANANSVAVTQEPDGNPLTQEITAEMVQQASWISRVTLNEAQCDEIAKRLTAKAAAIKALRTTAIDENTPMAMAFYPSFFLPSDAAQEAKPADLPNATNADLLERLRNLTLPDAQAEPIAFWTIEQLAAGLRQKRFSSEQLTKLYLDRLKKYDHELLCVVSYNEQAIEEAKAADQELANGGDRGILHGIPWGAKDIIAIPGMPTTWGAIDYRERMREPIATVAQRLKDAGAILLAKLTVGTLAWGDQWFGGMTRNPWEPTTGSSGSSAGSACATVAGLCGFAIGSETLGSIVSPTRICCTCGLRPSFGRVSRFGCMTLGWSMDKIGPIGRTPADCGWVFQAILGADGLDPTVIEKPFNWQPPDTNLKNAIASMRFGISAKPRVNEKKVAEAIREAGGTVIELDFPADPRIGAMTDAISVEAAAMHGDLFERITEDEQVGKWAPTFREAQFCSAIDYVQSMRARVDLIRKTEEVLRQVDVYIGDADLARTNLTGHPSMVVSYGENSARNRPHTVALTAKYFREAELLIAAEWIQKNLPPTPRVPSLVLSLVNP